MSQILQANADGTLKANQPATEQNTELKPFPDGKFVKYVDRPAPKGQAWEQKFVVNHAGKPIAIVPDKNHAEFICEAVNTFVMAIHANRAEAQKQADDAAAFETPVEQQPPNPAEPE